MRVFGAGIAGVGVGAGVDADISCPRTGPVSRTLLWSTDTLLQAEQALFYHYTVPKLCPVTW